MTRWASSGAFTTRNGRLGSLGALLSWESAGEATPASAKERPVSKSLRCSLGVRVDFFMVKLSCVALIVPLTQQDDQVFVKISPKEKATREGRLWGEYLAWPSCFRGNRKLTETIRRMSVVYSWLLNKFVPQWWQKCVRMPLLLRPCVTPKWVLPHVKHEALPVWLCVFM
jgi:hypothetical protein